MKNLRQLFSCAIVLSTFTLCSQVISDFEVSQTEGCGSFQVIFKDISTSATGSIVSWSWDLGGTTSTRQHPGKIFDTPGIYEICLTATDSNGNIDKVCKRDLIKVFPNPLANFDIDVSKGCSPLLVQYNDVSQSDNSIKEWIWDIGGSANVISTNDPNEVISSVYTTGGTYSASLTIKDTNGCINTVSKKDIVEVFDIPKVILSRDIIQICELPWQIRIKNENIDPNATYYWDFGNGQKYEGASPPIVSFADKGAYDVSVIVMKGTCRDTFIFEEYINTDVAFTIKNTKPYGCIGDSVFFEFDELIGYDSIRWSMGDGTIYTGKDVRHIYNTDDCYEISATVYWQGCTFDASISCFEVKKATTPLYNIPDQNSCSVPIILEIQEKSAGSYDWSIIDGAPTAITLDKSSKTINLKEFGNYLIKLEYTDTYGCKEVVEDIPINTEKFEAMLPSKGPNGCVPYLVEFRDSVLSATDIVSYQWSIPALNIMSNKPSPTFTLRDTGRFDVTLIVVNEYGCKDTIKRKGYLQGGVRPDVDFTVQLEEGCLKDERQFVDLSSSNVDYWIWDFGDEGTSLESNPTYTYSNPGIYDVSLTVFHNGCGASISKPSFITAKEPLSSFKINYNCADPYSIEIENLQLGGDSVYWYYQYEGGTMDTLWQKELSSLTFPSRGKHLLGMYSYSDSTGCEHVRGDTVYITEPKSYYELDTYRSCSPLVGVINVQYQDMDSFYFINSHIDINISGDSSISINPAGDYTLPSLVAVDIHGCTYIYGDTNNVLVNEVTAIANIVDVVCVPDSVSLFHESISLFGSIVGVTWSLADAFLSNLDSTIIYSEASISHEVGLHVVDDWGCEDSLIHIIEGVMSSPDFEGDSLGCTDTEMRFVPNDQSLLIASYQWDFGDGTVSNDLVGKHAYREEGTYTVCLTINDSRGCANQVCKKDYIAIANPKAAFEASPTFEECPPLLSQFNNKSVNAISYEWDFGDNSGVSYVASPLHVYTEPGIFNARLIAIRSNACKDTLQLDTLIEVLGPKGDFTYSVVGNCTPLEVSFVASSDKYYHYLWDFGNGQIDSSGLLVNADTLQFIYDGEGYFRPKLIMTDNRGCARTFTSEALAVNTINLTPMPQQDPLCDPELIYEIDNQSTSSANAVSYEWYLTHSQIKQQKFVSIPAFRLPYYGDYDLTLIGKTTNCIDTTFTDKYLTVGASPQLGLISNTFCDNSTQQLKVEYSTPFGNVSSINWLLANDTTMYSTDSVFTMYEAGRYPIAVTATTSEGCTTTIEQEIIIEQGPEINLFGDTIICKSQSADIIANISQSSNAAIKRWYDQEKVLCEGCEEIKIQPDSSQYYYFDIAYNNGCYASDSIYVFVAPVFPPEVAILDTFEICYGDTAQAIIIGHEDDYHYEWSNVKSERGDSAHVWKIWSNESKEISLTTTNKYGCHSQIGSMLKVEISTDDYLPSHITICIDVEDTLRTLGGKAWIWLDGHKDTLCIDCDKYLVNQTEDKKYYVLAQSALGCQYIDSVKVSVLDISSIDAGQDFDICYGETISPNSKGVGVASWFPLTGVDSATNITPQISPDSSRYYILTTVEDQCVLMDSFYVEVTYKTNIQGFGDTVCYGDQAFLYAEGDAHTILWYHEGEHIKEGFEQVLSPHQSTNLMVIGSRSTCIPDTAIVDVLVYDKIDYRLSDAIGGGYANSRYQIQAEYDSAANYTYKWTPADGLSCDDCPTPLIQGVPNNTSYSIIITDSDSQCSIELPYDYKRQRGCDKEGFFIPNAFSPNGDGENDFFYINVGNREEFRKIMIMNRWGNIVFQSSDSEFRWDGRIDGQLSGEGVYLFWIDAYCPENGEKYGFGGDITVIR